MNIKALLIIVSASLFGCVSNDLPLTPIKGSLGTEAVVKERQHIVFEIPNDEIRIEVLAITEARCPSDVVCIWAGYIQVSFKISATSETIDLAIPPNHPPGPVHNDNYSFSFSGNTYRLILKDVIPYPNRDNSTEVKSAVFELSLI